MGVRHVRDIELDVELEVSEGLIGHDVAVADRENAVGERPLRRSLAIRLNPALEAFPAQQDAGGGGGGGAGGGGGGARRERERGKRREKRGGEGELGLPRGGGE